MHEYTTTEAQRDARIFMTNNFFMAKVALNGSGYIWINVFADNAVKAESKVRDWLEEKGVRYLFVTAYPTLNAIENGIK